MNFRFRNLSNCRSKSVRARFIAVLIGASLAIASGAEAKTLVFPGTSVKELAAAGENWGDQTVATLVDTGKGIRYSDSGDEVGVALLDAAVPAETRRIFDGAPAVLTASQVAELAKSANPWILKYCGERGKPYLAQFGKKKFIAGEFIEEQRIRVAAPSGGAQCLSACKVEAHAFGLSRGKLVHIYWVRSVMRDGKTQPDAVLLKDVANKFDAMLKTVRWE